MSVLFGAPPKVLWLRCGNVSTDVIDALLRRYRETIAAFLASDDVTCLELN
jgi:predicted nuclease of predicted toxin-antitoxin system